MMTNPGPNFFTGVLRTILPILILVCGAGAFFVLADRPPLTPQPAPPSEAPRVETLSVERHATGLDLQVDGLVVPFREVAIHAEVAGRVVFKSDLCRAGRYVKQGDLLLRIDERDYDLEVERLTREQAQAEVSVREVDVERQNTTEQILLAEEEQRLQNNELTRQMSLSDRRVVTDSKLDEARRNELSARKALLTFQNTLGLLEARRARLVQAQQLVESQLARAELDRQRTSIVAPLDGVVVQEMVEEDAYVQKGTALLAIEDTSAVEVRCSLQMDELHWLWTQQAVSKATDDASRDYRFPTTPVTVTYDLAGRRYSWQGTLERYEGIGLDERTRTVPCRAIVTDPHGVLAEGTPEVRGAAIATTPLVRGMYVTVTIHARPEIELLRLPERAIRPGNVVWTVREGRLNVDDVEVVQVVDEVAVVHADRGQLVAGDRVIVSPLVIAEPNMAVREEDSP